MEFARHAEISVVLEKVQFYFPQPHHPWQRGTNEDTNGLLREYFPKSFNLDDVSEEYIQSKVDEMNKQPRKCLGYLTPYEVYFNLVALDLSIQVLSSYTNFSFKFVFLYFLI